MHENGLDSPNKLNLIRKSHIWVKQLQVLSLVKLKNASNYFKTDQEDKT